MSDRTAEIAELTRFIKESNAIEGVFGDQAVSDSKLAWYWLTSPHIKNLTLSNIKKAHKCIMLNQAIGEKDKGAFRTVDVWVGNHQGAPIYLLEDLMKQWIRRANKLKDPIADHVVFETIHPFIDGNGRVGRMLMNWQFYKMGKPLKIFTAEDRGQYYELFK